MTGPEGMNKENRAQPSWLAARNAADERARGQSVPLLHRLSQRLAPGPAEGIDLGTGTGANHRYLSALLTVPVNWTVLDHDQDLLDHPAHLGTTRVLAGIGDLDQVLDGRRPDRLFLTCSAVLDVLRAGDVASLASVIVARRLPFLGALSVTGEVALRPGDPLDGPVRAAFNAHQCREGRLGPGAPAYLAERLPAGWMQQTPTPWNLRASSDAALLRWYLSERAHVAVEQEPELAEPVAGWLQRRLTQLANGRLEVDVAHVDQLVLPS